MPRASHTRSSSSTSYTTFSGSFAGTSGTSSDLDLAAAAAVTAQQKPWYLRIFDDAAQFEDVLLDEPDHRDLGVPRRRRDTVRGREVIVVDDERDDSDEGERLRQSNEEGDTADAAPNTVPDLVGRDLATLDPAEALPSRAAGHGRNGLGHGHRKRSISGTRYSSTSTPSLSEGETTTAHVTSEEEHEHDEPHMHEDRHALAVNTGVAPQRLSSSPVPLTPIISTGDKESAYEVASTHPASTSISDDDDAVFDLTSEEKIGMFEDEFGVLAKKGDEEAILVEADGGFWQGVAIIGVVHLTTHRLTFHASLMPLSSSTPADPNDIIRAGPATAHRPNPYRKRKIWLELTSDMISTFRSSSDDERVKPIKSIRLIDIVHIRLPPDLGPRYLELQVRVSGSVFRSLISFGTEESASEWYHALQGAIFMQRRAHSIDGGLDDDEATNNGVRLSIPLERIQRSSASRMSATSLFRLEIHAAGDQLDDIVFVMQGEKMALFLEQFSRFCKLRVREAAVIESSAPWEIAPIIVGFGTLATARPGTATGNGTGEHPDITDSDAVLASATGEGAMRIVFALPQWEPLWVSPARIIIGGMRRSGYLNLGQFAISPQFICFWAKNRAFKDIKYRFVTSRFKAATPIRVFRGYGLQLEVEGYEPLIFAFTDAGRRDEAVKRLTPVRPGPMPLSALGNGTGTGNDASPFTRRSAPARSTSMSPALMAMGPRQALVRSASLRYASPEVVRSPTSLARSTSVISPLSRAKHFAHSRVVPPEIMPLLPKVMNLPSGLGHHIAPRHFVCLTIGSRGDVQPYIALGRGLMKEGHRVTIVTHEEYKEWIERWGISHRTAGGDPGALMKLSVDHKMFSPAFFKESLGHFRTWLDDLLTDSWTQCYDADVLIESPSAMAGVHIAEALKIPYFRAFTMPWSKTTEYPHAFISPPVESPQFNYASYVLFDNVFWVATSGQINKWRRETLQLASTDMSHMAQSRIPFIYNFSTAVVPKPLDWKDHISVTGYWFLDNPDQTWTPPAELTEFMDKARADGRPLVYIGFGSITVPRPTQMTQSIVKAVLKSDVRAIISKGWSTRMSKSEAGAEEIEYPPECFLVDSIPHDWLFPKIDAALHHGGAGTTGASLRAGIPTLIKPWFGDQFFWASRIQRLGAGLRVPSLRSSALAEALTQATSDSVMKERAASVGARIRSEDGVQKAIHAIYMYLPRAQRRVPSRELVSTNSRNCCIPTKRSSTGLSASATNISIVSEIPTIDSIPVYAN